jgi:hypothetical protein
MRALVRGACILAGLWGCVTIAAAPQDGVDTSTHATTPTQLVQRFIEASGGAELAKIKIERRTGTLIRGEAGAVSLDTLATDRGKWIYNQVFAYGQRVSYGCDGARAWIQDARGVAAMPPEIRRELEIALDVQFPLKLVAQYPEMAITGTAKIGEKEATLVSARSRGNLRIEFAFDRESGMLLRAGNLLFEDYRQVGKVKRPFVIFFGRNDGQDSLRLKMLIAEVRHDAAADGAVFRIPVGPLPPTRPVLYTLRTQAVVGPEALQEIVGVYQSAADPKVLYTVTTQGGHLMIEQTGWFMRFEILPESEADYFMRFANREFHFVKDAGGRVVALELGPDRAQKALRVK